jgi:hypothetical protein
MLYIREDFANRSPPSDGWIVPSLVILFGVVLASRYLPRRGGRPDTSRWYTFTLLKMKRPAEESAAAARQVLPRFQCEAGRTSCCALTRIYRSTGSWRSLQA